MEYNIFKGKENEKRNNQIWHFYYEKGWSLRELAKKFSISFQRVSQILRYGEYLVLKQKVEDNSSKK